MICMRSKPVKMPDGTTYFLTPAVGERVTDLYADDLIAWPGSAPSGWWVCAGAMLLNDRGDLVRRYTPPEVLRGNIQWKDDDGKQRVNLTDLDYGAERVWLHPAHDVRPVWATADLTKQGTRRDG
jgi:hypothetical protein